MLFTGKLYKKGDGMLPFQRRWNRYDASIDFSGVLALADEKTHLQVEHMTLGGVALLPDTARHCHQLVVYTQGASTQWRLKASSAQQLSDLFKRLQRGLQRGELPSLELDAGTSGLDAASSPSAGVWGLAAGAPTPFHPRQAAGAPTAAASPHTPAGQASQPQPPNLSPALQSLLLVPTSSLDSSDTAAAAAAADQPAAATPLFSPHTPALPAASSSAAPPSAITQLEPSLFLSPDPLTPLTALSTGTPRAVGSNVKEIRLRLLEESESESGTEEEEEEEEEAEKEKEESVAEAEAKAEAEEEKEEGQEEEQEEEAEAELESQLQDQGSGLPDTSPAAKTFTVQLVSPDWGEEAEQPRSDFSPPQPAQHQHQHHQRQHQQAQPVLAPLQPRHPPSSPASLPSAINSPGSMRGGGPPFSSFLQEPPPPALVLSLDELEDLWVSEEARGSLFSPTGSSAAAAAAAASPGALRRPAGTPVASGGVGGVRRGGGLRGNLTASGSGSRLGALSPRVIGPTVAAARAGVQGSGLAH